MELINPDDRQKVIERWHMVSDGQKVPLRETRIKRLNGQEIPIEVGLSPIEYDGRRAIQAIIRDTSDRKQAEEALLESERKYRELVQDANSIILSYDLAGKITFFNEYAQNFFGYKEQEILGKDVICLVPERESPLGAAL